MGTPTMSAGGVVFRRDGTDTLVVVVEWEEGVEEKWAPILRQLPKGGCKPGETLEETALREVREETGYQARIVSKAGEAQWSYERNGQVWDETVHYYLMEPVCLVLENHDAEFDYVRWYKADQAARMLSYPEERELLSQLIADGRLC